MMSSSPMFVLLLIGGALFVCFIAALALRKLLSFVVLVIAIAIGGYLALRIFQKRTVNAAPARPNTEQVSSNASAEPR